MLGNGKWLRRMEKCSPERLDRMEKEAYKMIDKIKNNHHLRKVYSDVNFYWLLGEINEYRGYMDDLEQAEILFLP